MKCYPENNFIIFQFSFVLFFCVCGLFFWMEAEAAHTPGKGSIHKDILQVWFSFFLTDKVHIYNKYFSKPPSNLTCFCIERCSDYSMWYIREHAHKITTHVVSILLMYWTNPEL